MIHALGWGCFAFLGALLLIELAVGLTAWDCNDDDQFIMSMIFAVGVFFITT